jgi:fibronectin-binding autotransporter adhesin
MSKLHIVGGVSNNRGQSKGSFLKGGKAAFALIGAAAIAPMIARTQSAMANLTWDPGMSGTGSGGGSGNWDTTAANTVWFNGTQDVAYATDMAYIGGTATTNIINVDGNVTANGIQFNTSGYTINGSDTLSVGTSGANTSSLVGANETFDAAVSMATATWYVDGTMTFGGAVLNSSTGAPVLAAATTDTATYVFNGDMSQFAGPSIEIGGGVGAAVAQKNIVTGIYSSTAGSGNWGASSTATKLAYNGDLEATDPLYIAGDLTTSGGANQGLGDLSQNGETISGSANVNVGFNATGGNTTVANGVSGGAPLTFIGANTGNFLTNILGSGSTLTFGQAGASTSFALSSTNAGRIVTLGGSGATVINSSIEDASSSKSGLQYVNSILAYNGTGSGSLTLTSTANSYKGATYIEQGTVKLGANSALPTGQGLPTADDGGTPGLVVFGDTDPNKNSGGILDLAGFNQTVAGLAIQTALPQASISSAFQGAIWTVSAATAAGTSSFLTVSNNSSNYAPYTTGVGLAIGEGVTIGSQTGTIISLANVGGASTPSLLVGLSFDPAAGNYDVGAGGGITLNPTVATASKQIITNSSTVNNSTLTFSGGNTGGTYPSTEGTPASSTFGGTIEDGASKTVALNVVAGTLNLTGTSTYSGGTTVNGASGATLNVTGSIANNSSSGVFLGDTAAFGTKDNLIIRSVATNGSYAGLGATELGGLGTKIDLVQGSNVTNGSALGVSLEMRLVNANDLLNLPAAPSDFVSDVAGLTGLTIGGGSSGETDPYAVQMTYLPSLALNSHAGSIFLASTNNAESVAFSNAIGGNFATGADAQTDVQSSYASFASANSITDSNLGLYLGSWGVDTTGDTAWAVVDYDSQFAVVSVPEPASLGALAVCGAALLSRRSRRTRKA